MHQGEKDGAGWYPTKIRKGKDLPESPDNYVSREELCVMEVEEVDTKGTQPPEESTLSDADWKKIEEMRERILCDDTDESSENSESAIDDSGMTDEHMESLRRDNPRVEWWPDSDRGPSQYTTLQTKVRNASGQKTKSRNRWTYQNLS